MGIPSLALPSSTQDIALAERFAERIDNCLEDPDLECMTELRAAYEKASGKEIAAETNRLASSPGLTGNLVVMVDRVYFPHGEACAMGWGGRELKLSDDNFRRPFIDKWAALPRSAERLAITEALSYNTKLKSLAPPKRADAISALTQRFAEFDTAAMPPDPFFVPL